MKFWRRTDRSVFSSALGRDGKKKKKVSLLLLSLPQTFYMEPFAEWSLATGPTSFSECRAKNTVCPHQLSVIYKHPNLAKTQTGCNLQREPCLWISKSRKIRGQSQLESTHYNTRQLFMASSTTATVCHGLWARTWKSGEYISSFH